MSMCCLDVGLPRRKYFRLCFVHFSLLPFSWVGLVAGILQDPTATLRRYAIAAPNGEIVRKIPQPHHLHDLGLRYRVDEDQDTIHSQAAIFSRANCLQPSTDEPGSANSVLK